MGHYKLNFCVLFSHKIIVHKINQSVPFTSRRKVALITIETVINFVFNVFISALCVIGRLALF